jgi:hypothetical protein
MPYEPVTWFLPPNPDGTTRLVSIVPRKDRPGADLECWDLPEQLVEEPCHLLELPLEVMSNILHQVSFPSCSRLKIVVDRKLTVFLSGRSKTKQIFMPCYVLPLGFTTSSCPSGGSI